jgi:hypothetical protein
MFEQFAPDADALLRAITPHIDDRMLEAIAAADRGSMMLEHLAQLRHIRDTLVLPNPMNWVPGEVLALMSYSDPDDTSRKPGSQGQRGHWIRAFCCAILLRGNCEPDTNQTLIQLINSLQRLDAGLDIEATSMLAWLLPRLEVADSETVFVAVGLLWSALRIRPHVTDQSIGQLCQWIEDWGTKHRGTDVEGHDFGITQMFWSFFDSHSKDWNALGQAFLDGDWQTRSQEVQNSIARIGAELARPWEVKPAPVAPYSLIVDVTAFAPDADALMRALARHIDEGMLVEISAADNGEQAGAHLAALRRVRDGTAVANPLEWVPHEVLAQSRSRGTDGARGAWIRTFACAALLRVAPDDHGVEETLAHLTRSLSSLNFGNREAASTLAWLTTEYAKANNDQSLACAVALLWHALRFDPPLTDPPLLGLCEMIGRLSAAASQSGDHDAGQITALDIGRGYGVAAPVWRQLGRELGGLDLCRRSADVQRWVGLIGAELAKP